MNGRAEPPEEYSQRTGNCPVSRQPARTQFTLENNFFCDFGCLAVGGGLCRTGVKQARPTIHPQGRGRAGRSGSYPRQAAGQNVNTKSVLKTQPLPPTI